MSSEIAAQPGPVIARIPTGRFVGQYLLMLVATVAAVFALYWALDTFAGYQSGGSDAMGLILPAVAGMSAASGWYSKHATRPPGGQFWTLAQICGLITGLINIGVIVMLYRAGLLQDELGAPELSRQDMQIFAAVIAGITVLQVLLVRAGIWYGFRVAAKQRRK